MKRIKESFLFRLNHRELYKLRIGDIIYISFCIFISVGILLGTLEIF